MINMVRVQILAVSEADTNTIKAAAATVAATVATTVLIFLLYYSPA